MKNRAERSHPEQSNDPAAPLSSAGNATPLRALVASCRSVFWSIGVFSAVINLLMLAPALYMLQVYDRVLPSSNTMTLAMLTALTLGLFVLMGLLEWVRSAVVIRLGTQWDMQLNQRIYNAAFASNLQGQGVPAAQALNDLTTLRQFATGNALFAFFDAPWFPLYLLVIFLLHPWLGVTALAGAALLILLAWLNQRLTQRDLMAAGRVTVLATQQANANLRHADTLEAMGMLDAMRQRWLCQHQQFLHYQNTASEKSACVTAISKCARLALQSVMLGLGALLAVNGDMTAGMMIAGSILVGRVLSPIDQLIGVWKQWTQARLAWQRLNDLLDAHPVRQQGMALPAPKGELRVEQLAAKLPQATRLTLQGLSFTLQPGDVLGVLGPSGCGKSTLARLLVGALTPLSGHVRLDGADLHQWRNALRGQFIGYLPQDIQLFSGTIADNIARFAAPNAASVVAAAQTAGVHELILRLPQGYDTPLGENGAGLSGGQKQRVALARALYERPRLIVLDEPNANLDEDGEKALLSAIKAQQDDASTQILITHKPSLLTCANKLLVLRDGQISHFGPTEQVLREMQRAGGTSRPASRPAANVFPSPAGTPGLSMVYNANAPRKTQPDAL